MSLLGENITTYLLENFGGEYLSKYEEFIQSQPDFYIRAGIGIDQEHLVESLKKYDIEITPVGNVPNAFKIEKGLENIGKTVEFTLGMYYIQSLSSMIPPLVLNPTSEDTVLDLCAAPGSKTTEISELMNNRGTLYANEISVPRLRSLVHNLDKVNAVNVGVLNYKGELLSKIYDHYFDKILVDAPCSALGILQKKEEVSNWWNSTQMEKIANLQLRLLIAAIKMAKVGGEIVYSTCTLTLEENELVLERVLKKYPVELVEFELPVVSKPPIMKYGSEDLNPEIFKAKRIIPWEINSEGFFVAKLIKTGETETKRQEIPKKREAELLSANNKKVKKYLQDTVEWFGLSEEILSDFQYLLKGKDIYFLTKDWHSNSLQPFNRLGTKFGNVDSRGIAHMHTQSMQLLSRHFAKNIVELENVSQLKTYFEGGICKDIKIEKGQKIVKYMNYTLGAAIALDEGLKSQFPRSHRTSVIIFPEE